MLAKKVKNDLTLLTICIEHLSKARYRELGSSVLDNI